MSLPTGEKSMSNNLVIANYNGMSVSFTDEAWFNATEVAKSYGKRPNDWLNLDETKAYIDALSQILITSQNGNKNPPVLVMTKTGRRQSGTWLHPKLSVRFAQWLDIKFAVWCDMQIDSILRASYSPPSMMQLLLTNTATKWELRFTPEFYSALARVTKTKYNGHSQGTPCVFGQITLKWVYQEIMPDDVLLEVKNRKNDSDKIHQWLSNGGQKLLDNQIAKIHTIAQSSIDYADFMARCFQACTSRGQLRLVWPQVAA